jgi:hypothetical protein
MQVLAHIIAQAKSIQSTTRPNDNDRIIAPAYDDKITEPDQEQEVEQPKEDQAVQEGISYPNIYCEPGEVVSFLMGDREITMQASPTSRPITGVLAAITPILGKRPQNLVDADTPSVNITGPNIFIRDVNEMRTRESVALIVDIAIEMATGDGDNTVDETRLAYYRNQLRAPFMVMLTDERGLIDNDYSGANNALLLGGTDSTEADTVYAYLRHDVDTQDMQLEFSADGLPNLELGACVPLGAISLTGNRISITPAILDKIAPGPLPTLVVTATQPLSDLTAEEKDRILGLLDNSITLPPLTQPLGESNNQTSKQLHSSDTSNSKESDSDEEEADVVLKVPPLVSAITTSRGGPSAVRGRHRKS